VSSIKDRQRAAARARLEKEMAERAEAARRRRQRQAVIGSAIAVIVLAGVAFWVVSSLGSDDGSTSASPSSSAAAPGTATCTWTPAQEGGGKIKDVGTPPVNVPAKGSATMTINSNLGPVEVKMDLAKVPCTGASFEYLASKKFWDNTKCHRLVNENSFKVLQCGDPFATGKGYRDTDGTGGPSYTMAEENLPTDAAKPYPAGSIAMANTGQPNTSGSQFFICSEDTNLPASYTLLGTVTKGLNIVKRVVAAGDDGAFKAQAGGGHPKKEFAIKTLRVTKG
jgi:peptidyl-prolyl cis-trans isomerase B (cyclophilin B)